MQTELDAFWTREFRDTARQYTPPEVTVDDTARSNETARPDSGRRTDGRGPDRAYSNTRTGAIHFPRSYLAAVHAADGDRAYLVLTFTMGHEFGHRVQFLLHPETDARINDIEAQADCYAGVWARQEADAGKLEVEQFHAAASAELHRLSSYPDEIATHGTPAQRVASLDKGLGGGGPAVCDRGTLTWLPRHGSPAPPA